MSLRVRPSEAPAAMPGFEHIKRYWDAKAGIWVARIAPGEFYITRLDEMISTVLGGLPLVLASGAGAEARIALGWVIVGGLGLATLATLFVTPVAYLLLARFSTPKAAEQARLERELAEAEAEAG